MKPRPADVPPLDLAVLPRRTPEFVTPMECTPVARLPDDATDWIYELKLDGWRCVAAARGQAATLYSRYGNSLNSRFPAVRSAVTALPGSSCVLDGELVALDADGRPVFQAIQNHRTTQLPVFYYVFDLLLWNGRSLLHVPLTLRKALLAAIAAKLRDPIRHAPALDGPLSRLVREVRTRRLEGLVAKRRSSMYRPGLRSPDWLKHRFNRVEEFIVGGFIPGDFPAAFRLLVGRARNGRLEYVASVRNGFSGDARERVAAVLRKLRHSACPFANLPERGTGRGVLNREKMQACVWVKPQIAAEVEFVNWTEDGHLRHEAFRRLLPPHSAAPQ